jgi:hypothetical protein
MSMMTLSKHYHLLEGDERFVALIEVVPLPWRRSVWPTPCAISGLRYATT